MANIDTFRKFIMDVSSGQKPAETSCTAVDLEDFWNLHSAASKGLQWLAAKGVTSRVSGNGNIRENGFTLAAGNYFFDIKPPAIPGKKGVAETSRIAYANMNTSEQALKVSKAVIELLETYGWVSDSLVESKLGIPAGRVSARRNEIEKEGAAVVDGVLYHFQKAPQKIKCPVTGSTVNGWALRKPSTLF